MVEKTEEMQEKDNPREKATALFQKINKQYGKGTMAWASDNPFLDIQRLPTGIFPIDYALSGGFPVGRISEIHGEWSSGKTFVALKLVAMAQRICRKDLELMQPTDKSLLRCPLCGSLGTQQTCSSCSTKKAPVCREDWGDREILCPICKKYNPHIVLWMDLEGAYDKQWATFLDINNDYIIVVRPRDAEMCGDIYRETFLNKEIGVDIGVIDSLAMMTPIDEINESMEKDNVGKLPRLVNRFVRSMVSIQNDYEIRKSGRKPTQIIINQIRQKVGVLYANPTVKPGGRAQEFASSVDLRLWRSTDSNAKEDSKTNERVINVCNFVVEKNRTGPVKRGGSFRIWIQHYQNKRPGWTNEPEVITDAMEKANLVVCEETLDIMDRSEAQDADKKIISRKALIDRLENDIVFWWNLRRKLFDYRLGYISDDVLKKGKKEEKDDE